MHYKFLMFLICLTLIHIGCESQPLHEINFKAKLPKEVLVSSALTDNLAESIANNNGLKVMYKRPTTGNTRTDQTYSVHLDSIQTKTMQVTVISDKRSNMIFIRIMGGINSELARQITKNSTDTFNKMFPNINLEQYTRRQGLLGP